MRRDRRRGESRSRAIARSARSPRAASRASSAVRLRGNPAKRCTIRIASRARASETPAPSAFEAPGPSPASFRRPPPRTPARARATPRAIFYCLGDDDRKPEPFFARIGPEHSTVTIIANSNSTSCRPNRKCCVSWATGRGPRDCWDPCARSSTRRAARPPAAPRARGVHRGPRSAALRRRRTLRGGRKVGDRRGDDRRRASRIRPIDSWHRANGPKPRFSTRTASAGVEAAVVEANAKICQEAEGAGSWREATLSRIPQMADRTATKAIRAPRRRPEGSRSTIIA